MNGSNTDLLIKSYPKNETKMNKLTQEGNKCHSHKTWRRSRATGCCKNTHTKTKPWQQASIGSNRQDCSRCRLWMHEPVDKCSQQPSWVGAREIPCIIKNPATVIEAPYRHRRTPCRRRRRDERPHAWLPRRGSYHHWKTGARICLIHHRKRSHPGAGSMT